MPLLRSGTLLLCLLALSFGGARGQTWVQKIGGSGLGNPLVVNPLNHDVLYTAAGTARVYISRTQGYSWDNYGNIVPGGGIIKSICVSPLDTLKLLAGIEAGGGSFDRVSRTTDGGVTWTDVWSGSFSYYGQPLEFAPEHPDTVFVMGWDTLWRSIDFGATWDTMTSHTPFSTWCDAAVRPDSANILLLGDNATGIWKSTNAGAAWVQKYSTFGEIPSIAIDPFNPHVAYASKYSGGGGMVKSTNGGETWFGLTVPSGNRDAWWVTCSRAHPGWVYYGTYTGDTTVQGVYLSRNSGATWQRFPTGLWPSGLLNYGLLAVDSLTVVAFQGAGIYKLQFPTAAHVSSPNGGEFFRSGNTYPVSWSSSYLPLVTLEYSTNNGSTWNLIADSLDASASPYAWTVPPALSNTCRLRVADTRFSGAADMSDAVFTMSSASITLTSPSGGAVWNAGSWHGVTWSSTAVSVVRVEYSVDSMATWDTLTLVPAGPGSYGWTIPERPSTKCFVRLADTSDANVFAMSAMFTIGRRISFLTALRVRDGGGLADTLRFGAAPGATDGIDSAFGEIELGPKPPSGTFDARWSLPPTAGTSTDVRDTLGPSNQENVFLCRFQPGPSGYPVTLTWSRDSLGAGSFILRDTLTRGRIYSADMRKESTLVITDPSVTAVEILECTSVTIDYSGTGGWRLVSIPVLTGDRRKSTLFPYASSGAYAFAAGYHQHDTLEPGSGYWLKTEPASLTGCALTVDTISVHAGWNIIGSLSQGIALGSVVTVPDSLLSSNTFGYENGYFTADSILPGNGYWVKAKSDGILVQSALMSLGARTVETGRQAPLANTLVVSDARGGSQELRFGPGSREMSGEMPPPGPEGAFDARFTPSSLAQSVPENFESELHFPISVRSGANRIFFSWHVENEEKFTYILSEIEDTRVVSEIGLTSDGNADFTHSAHSSFALTVRRTSGPAGIPRGYSMGELYPNPFNPTTSCTFSVPVEARVTITVYSLLGRVVAALLDESRAPGSYTAAWNGTSESGVAMSSGVYYVRMTASPSEGKGFTRVQKVLYLK